MNKKKINWKTTLDIAEDICTIIVSLMAVWGTVVAFQHDLFHKTLHLVDYYHSQLDQTVSDIKEKI